MDESEFPRDWVKLTPPFTVESNGSDGVWRSHGWICCNAVIRAIRIRENPAGGFALCRKVITVGTKPERGDGLVYSKYEFPVSFTGIIYRDLNIRVNQFSIFVNSEVPIESRRFCSRGLSQLMDVDVWLSY